MITLYGTPNTRSVRVLWALEETGIAYDYRKMDLKGGECRQAEYLAINPNGKVPALVDGDLTLLETNAICHYIAELGTDLLPNDIKARAKVRQWNDFALSELEVAPWMLLKNQLIYPSDERLAPEALRSTMVWESQRAQGILILALEHQDYLLPTGFSLADIHICVGLLMHFKTDLPLRPELLPYLKRCMSRPAIARLQAMGELPPLPL
ncbi:glutathione S-transferase family protein [Shewanella amazonensis]|uniref:Glutathione S-transferase-like protein n=1 Tax=Shewanella amazonensis (strain ATCC BAA-1098 / SB2B) TaxID=326297 RepID=A1S8K5_SHEAM|nr:glutathione S-transferase family protein [Shewanella amazonensis]ABM00712.1 glutathione S-transferase-like protein [Shewanella amazonensis SB2B]